MLNTGWRQKQTSTGKDSAAWHRLFLRLGPVKSVDVNDRGQSQLQQQEEVIYTERTTLMQMDVWAETLGNLSVCLLIRGRPIDRPAANKKCLCNVSILVLVPVCSCAAVLWDAVVQLISFTDMLPAMLCSHALIIRVYEMRVFLLRTHTLNRAWRLNEDINTRTTSPELLSLHERLTVSLE